MKVGCELELRDVSLDYGGEAVVCGCSLKVGPGEHHVLLGESGSGKTTLLRAIAGFERCSAGSIVLGGDVVDERGRWIAPERRGVGVVFQEYALFPHLSVIANVAFARGDEEQARELLAAVGLSQLAERGIGQLSGGEQQRVAVARALAQQPRVMLLDEPFSNLNVELRRSTRELTSRVLREHGVTAVYVTHDRDEAFAVADRISVIHGGRVLATGSPRDLYQHPPTARVAAVTGEVSLLRVLELDGGRARTAVGWIDVYGEGEVVALRPEQLRIGDGGRKGKVIACEFLGAHCRLEVASDDWSVVTTVPANDAPTVAAEVDVSIVGTADVVADDRAS